MSDLVQLRVPIAGGSGSGAGWSVEFTGYYLRFYDKSGEQKAAVPYEEADAAIAAAVSIWNILDALEQD